MRTPEAIPVSGLFRDVRVMAAGAVAKIDPTQTGALIPILVNALKNGDAPLVGAAADELGALGKHAEPALPALFGLLGDDCAAVRAIQPGKRSGGSQVIEALPSKWAMSFFVVRIGLIERSEADYSFCWEMRGEVESIRWPRNGLVE
jgi:HEAT repeats